MGILGVESYAEKHPRVVYTVKIKDLIPCRRCRGAKNLCIVVDGKTFMNRLYMHFDWSVGGQFLEYVEVVHRFVAAFSNMGVDLIFCFQQSSSEHVSNAEWLEYKQRVMDALHRIMNMIDEGTSPSLIMKQASFCTKPTPLQWLTVHLLRGMTNCRVIICRTDRKVHVLKYARRFDAVAVLAQSSYYLFYDLGCRYVSMEHLNIRKMTTKCYDRRKLAESLGIDTSELAAFGSLRKLHCPTFSHAWSWNKFNDDRDFIKKFGSFTCPDAQSLVIANKLKPREASLFLDRYRRFAAPHITEDPSPSECPGGCVASWKAILMRAQERIDMHSEAYTALVERAVCNWVCLEHVVGNAFHVYGLLRRRAYGILFHEHSCEGYELKLKEWTVIREGMHQVSVVDLPGPYHSLHPGLLALWGDSKEEPDENIVQCQWALFSYAVVSSSQLNQLRNVPQYLVVPAAVLCYLHSVADVECDIWELKAFIIQAVILHTATLTSLSEIEIFVSDPRAMQLATLFIQGALNMQMLMDIVGYPVTKEYIFPHKYFDGKLFHFVYVQMKNGESGMDLLETQNQIADFMVIEKVLFSHKDICP